MAIVITPRTDLPLTLDGVKDYLQETENDNDALINQLIESATDWIERKTNRCLMTTIFEQHLSAWPACNLVRITWNPVQTLDSVKYVDEAGDEQTINAANYATWIRDEVMYVSFNDDYTWPTTKAVPDALKIRFTAGYNPPDRIPAPVKNAILLRIRKAYDNRQDEAWKGRTASDYLLEPYIIYL